LPRDLAAAFFVFRLTVFFLAVLAVSAIAARETGFVKRIAVGDLIGFEGVAVVDAVLWM